MSVVNPIGPQLAANIDRFVSKAASQLKSDQVKKLVCTIEYQVNVEKLDHTHCSWAKPFAISTWVVENATTQLTIEVAGQSLKGNPTVETEDCFLKGSIDSSFAKGTVSLVHMTKHGDQYKITYPANFNFAELSQIDANIRSKLKLAPLSEAAPLKASASKTFSLFSFIAGLLSLLIGCFESRKVREKEDL